MNDRTINRKLQPGTGDVDLDNSEVVDLVRSWIEERQPNALVRFGEGEGRLLVARLDDEDSLRVAANKVKRQAGIAISSDEVMDLRNLITRAIDEANVVGIRGSEWFNEEHTMWVKRIEELFAQRLQSGRRPTFVCHCLISSAIRDALPTLLKPGAKVSAVTSRDLGGLLWDNYGVDARVYQIPSQFVMRGVDGEYESTLHGIPIWPDFIAKLREELVVREQGEVFLVGAGLFGKELCIAIRERGGIALDMGSCLDGLAGKVTRGRHKPAAWGGSLSAPSVPPPAVSPPVPESVVPPPAVPESPVPPAAGSTARARARRVIARKFHPYLEKSGWLLSHTSGAPVDGAGKPVPWYRYAAIDFLAERANKTQKVFEFGCGNSTLWWADKVAHVTAVEHHAGWAQRIAGLAPANVSVMEVELVPDGEYCRTPLGCGGKFDVIIIDGRDRVNCALQCLPALANDGVIIWDDSMRRRYRHGLRFLMGHGFKRIRFTGLGPIGADDGETSVLYRDQNCFQI